METPDPVRSPKLSNHGRVQYSGGGPPGKRTYCTVPLKKSYDGEWSEVRTIWGPPTLGRFRAAESPVCLPSLSSLLSLPSLDHFSLSLSSRLGLVILGWQWSASPGVVRFHPGLSPLLIVSLPPPTRVGTCLLFQVSSFKLLGLEYPPCPPLPPRAALSRILGASLLGHSPHRISPPSLPLLCGVNGERDSTDSPHSLLSPPRRLALEPHGSPPSLSLRTLVCLIASSPPSISLRVCVCVCVNGESWI